MSNDFIGSESGFFIPPGREVVIKASGKNGQNIFSSANPNGKNTLINPGNVHLIYEGGLSLKISNKYGSIVESSGSNFMSLLASSGSVGGHALPSGQFALQGMQIWQSTDPINFSLDVALYAQTSAKKEVWNPALYLTSLTVPSTTNPNGKETAWNIIPPGPNIATIMNQIGLKPGNNENSNDFIKFNGARGDFTIDIGGYAIIRNVVIESITPEFSEALIEEDGEYFPISCRLTIDFTTMRIATAEAISSLMKK